MSALIMKRFTLLMSILFWGFNVASQDYNPSYTAYTKADGLPSNVVYDALTDKDVVLWIGTDAGLVRTDGYNYKVYTTKQGLPSNDVFKLYCDSYNRVWLETMSKEPSYIQNDFIHNKSNTSNLRSIESIKNIYRFYEDQNRNIWLFSSEFKMYVVRPSGEVLNTNLNFIPRGVAIVNNVIYILSDWDQSQCYIEHNKIKLIHKKLTSKAIIYEDGVITNDGIFIVDKGKLAKIKADTIPKMVFGRAEQYVSYNRENQLVRIDSDGIKFYQPNNLTKPQFQYFRDKPLLHYTNDHLGNHWLTTNGMGLWRLNSFAIKTIQSQKSEQNVIMSICTTDRYLIFGDMNGTIQLYDKNTLSCKDKVTIRGKFTSRILNIKSVKDKLIIATDFGLVMATICEGRILHAHRVNKESKNSYILGDSILVTAHSQLELFTLGGKSLKILPIGMRAYSALPTQQGLLIGTEEGLIQVSKDFKYFELAKPTLFNRILDMAMQLDTLYLATINSGVIVVKNNRILDTLNEKKGLSNNNCFRLKVMDNHLYIATQNGLNVYDLQTKKLQSFYTNNGLLSNVVHDISVDAKNVYAATDEGVSIIPRSELQTRTQLSLFAKPIMVGDDTLWEQLSQCQTHTNANVNIVLNTAFSNLKGRLRYFYRVDGAEFTSTIDPSISLNFQKPGTYQFEAYALHEFNIRSNMIKLKIHVIPFWWQTTGFKIFMTLLSLLFILLIIYFTNKITTKREQTRNVINNKLLFLEFSVWKSRINPHFIFNSLNSIHTLIRSRQNQLAEQFVLNFSKILRKTLSNSNKLVNTIEEEVDYIRNYLNLEQIKKKQLLQFEIYQPTELANYYIPSMILQPIIENSIKHGIRENEVCIIQIHFQRKGEWIISTLIDNGPGFVPTAISNTASTSSYGIHSIRDKIKIVETLLNKPIAFEIKYADDLNKTGCLTIFKFPILEHEIQNSNHSS